MKNRDNKIKFIQGYIDFAHANFSALTETELGWWYDKLSDVLGFADWRGSQNSLEEMIELQCNIRETLYWLYDKFKMDNLYLQVNVPRCFSLHQYNNGELEDVFDYTDFFWLDESITINVYTISTPIFNNETALESRKADQSINSFLQTISNFPTSSLLKCKNCSKIIFNPTKRKKVFCSERCQNTAAVRRHRLKKG